MTKTINIARCWGGAASASALALAAAAPAWAQAPADSPAPQAPTVPAGGAAAGLPNVNMTLIDMLLRNGVITQAQHDQLAVQIRQRDQATQTAAGTQPPPAPGESASNQQTAQATPKPSLLQKVKDISVGDGVTFKLGGRIQADYGFGKGDKTRVGTGQEMRRARLDFSGKLGRDFDYMLSYDFATNDLKNAYLEYIGLKDTAVSFGYFKEYFSLEYQTSNKATEFQERSMLNDSFDPPKRIGIGYFRNSKLNDHAEYTFGIGAFGNAVPQDTDRGDHSGFGVAARGTIVPYRTATKLLHLGLSLEYRDPGKTEEIDLSTHPNAHFAPSLIDTNDILGVNKQYKYSAEFAAVLGRLAVQGQYDQMRFTRFDASTLHFKGYYAQASFFLTNDSRAPAYDGGSYGTIKPHSKYGAWQIAARYDTQDLNTQDIIGGKEANVDGALNYYVNKYVRFSVNYIKVLKLDRPGDIHDHDKPTIVASRVWIGF
jgi:phosphate-selective porin OprO and OprP